MIPQTTSKLEHGVICADCRDGDAIKRLLGGRKINVVVTSPPYASQRKYDESSGFKPIAPNDYVDWYKDVASVIWDNLADDGSYFLNIKAHADDGERDLYVHDLVLAHKRQWGWRFVDEFCWKRQGFPGGYVGRFKNEWEPVFHFSKAKGADIKFNAPASDFDYDPYNPKNMRMGADGSTGKGGLKGTVARPGNVLEFINNGSPDHSAAYPVALPEFFINAFSDPGDVVFDPFLGSGTTMVAAIRNGRSGFGCELSPGYCDVIVQRATTAASEHFHLDGDGRTFEELAAIKASASV